MNEPSSNDDERSLGDYPSVFCIAPATATARANDRILRKCTTEVGHRTVAAAIGRDKSAVSRFFSGEAKVSLPELLHVLDVCGLKLASNVEEHDLTEYLSDTCRTIDANLKRMLDSGKLTDEVATALTRLASHGLQAMRSRE